MRLTETDAAFIYMESASGPMHISSVYVLDKEVPFEKVRHRVQACLPRIPSYRRKLAQIPFSLGHPKWVDDAGFNLDNHVIHCELPPDSSLQDGVDKAVQMNEPMLDRSRPLWRFVVLTGVAGRTLVLQQTHHALIDGASGIELTTILYDLDPNAPEPEVVDNWQPQQSPSTFELINEAIAENFSNLASLNPVKLVESGRQQGEWLRKATTIMSRFITRPAITAPFNAAMVGPHRRVRWLKKPFSEIREIRRYLGGTINDVVLAVVSEAVARYLVQHNERVADQHLRIMCPVNVRTEDQQGALGNQVSAIFPMLPAWPMPTLERLQTVIAETERIKNEQEAQALTVMQDSMPTLPPLGMAMTQLVGTSFDPTRMAAAMPMPVAPNMGYRPPNPGYNFTCTNVPGVQVPQYMCGAEVTDTIGLLVLNGNIGFSVTILSYNKQLFFNFIAEPRLLPDLETIVGAADDVFEQLLAAATDAAKQLNQSG